MQKLFRNFIKLLDNSTPFTYNGNHINKKSFAKG